MSRWRTAAGKIAAALPDRGDAARLLVVSCLHNRGFRFVTELAGSLRPDLLVNAGDVSGIGGPAEALILRAVWRIRVPQVFAPGNHDSEVTTHVMLGKGAVVLDPPQLVPIPLASVGDVVRFWGYRDPNRSPFGGPPYDSKLCDEAARGVTLPRGEALVAVVHNSRMVPNAAPEAGLVLCGHRHVPGVERRGDRVVARCGTTGGGGLHWPWKKPGPFQGLLVDLALPEHRAARIWLLESDGSSTTVKEG
jgi:hypothetical protein